MNRVYSAGMDMPYGSEAAHAFVTNVGLITSTGPHGENIMAAEWTHHISYSPALIAVCIGKNKATNENIEATKIFGISIAAASQTTLASVAGGSSGRDVDKISLITELGFSLYRGSELDLPMVEGARLNVECRLTGQHEEGDHVMYIGEAVSIASHPERTQLIYSQGKFWHYGEKIAKPPEEDLERIAALTEKYKKS